MKTKAIAIDSRGYDRLEAVTREGESFSEAIARLLVEAGASHTGSDIRRGLDTVCPLSQEDSEEFFEAVAKNRTKPNGRMAAPDVQNTVVRSQAATDASFAEMASDPIYRREALAVAEEFGSADWESFRISDEAAGESPPSRIS